MKISVNYKVLGAFGLGAAIGCGVSWIFAKKKYEEYARKEVDEMREYYLRKRNELILHGSSASKEDNTKGEDAEVHASMEEYKENEIRKAYDTIDSDTYNEEHEDEYDDVAETFADDVPTRMISVDEFGEYSSLEEAYITYFVKNDIFRNDKTGEIIDPESVFGVKNTEYIKDSDDDYLYFRNEKSGFDYEVNVLEDEWDG